MPEGLKDEQWRSILELAHAAVELPKDERLNFLKSSGSSSDVIEQVLVLADAFEQPSQANDRIGAKIGHFVIDRHLGAGGMGDVYSARDLELERTVALKFLNPESMGLEGAGEKFIREARTASALNHPNIVTIHEVLRSDSTVAIVMELIEGTPLRQLCGTPLPVERLVRIARQITDALGAAHAAGVVHRDLKPENMMVRPDGRVKVLDFGLAQRFMGAADQNSRNSAAAPFAGTWRYMSPEQCKGETLTGSSDVFSLGLVLYELASGRHAFEAESPFETLQAIASETPAPPSKWNPLVPRHVDDLILSMLAKDPTKRPTTEKIANELTTGISSTRTKPFRLIAAVILVLAAIAALAWRFFPVRKGQPAFYQVTTLVPENRATAAAISMDGKFVAFANTDGIYLRTALSGDTTTLRGPSNFVVDHLSWFADGAKLIAGGFSVTTNQPKVWSISTSGAPPREVGEEARGAVPSPDGSRIAFISNDHSAIWVMGPSGEEPRKVVEGPTEDTFLFVLWSGDGRSLWFQRRHYSGKDDLGSVILDRYYKRSFECFDLRTGRVTSRVPDLWIESAVTLPDGRVLFLRLDPPGSDISNELWEAETDPATGAFRGSPRKVASPIAGTRDRIYGMSATSDGSKIMVLRSANQNAIFVADFERNPTRFSNSRRLTLDERSNYPHTWTADSSAVIFESDRNGSWDIFKQRIDQRTPEAIIATPLRWEVLPQLSPNGQSVLYAAGPADGRRGPYTLMRVPLEGGPPKDVPIGGLLDEFRCAVGKRCIIKTTVERKYWAFHELDPVRGIGRELVRTAWLPALVGDWALSQDGTRVAIPNHDSRSARIRVTRLDDSPKQPKEEEVNLAGLTDLSGLGWVADGSGWFVTVNTTIGVQLIFVSLDGRWRSLGDIQGWAVPSPDGKRVAYLNKIVAANAWVIERR